MRGKRTLALFLIFFTMILTSCATRQLVLYNDGNPLSITEYEKIAQRERDNNRYDNAIKAYNAIITHYSDNSKAAVWANYEIGFCYYVQKEYSEAEKYFRIVINEFQEPAAKKLAEDMIAKIFETKKKKK